MSLDIDPEGSRHAKVRNFRRRESLCRAKAAATDKLSQSNDSIGDGTRDSNGFADE